MTIQKQNAICFFSENVVSPKMAMVYWETPSRDPCKNTRVDLLLKVSPPGPSSNLLIRTSPGTSEGNPPVPGEERPPVIVLVLTKGSPFLIYDSKMWATRLHI